MDIVTVRSIFTVLVVLAFLGVWVWAWSSRRKEDFEEAARLPLDDDPPAATKESSHE